MIGIFKNIMAGVPMYYVAEEIEVNGFKKFTYLSGLHENKSEAEKILKSILKKKGIKEDDKKS